MSLTLYAHPFSSYSQKVLIALYENEIAFRYRHLEEEGANDELRALWPLGLFPLLVDGDRTIFEATAIIEHLALCHPGPVALLPADPEPLVEARMLDRVFDLYVMTPMQVFVNNALRPEGQADLFGADQARTRLDTIYAWLDTRLAGREWAAGSDFSLADCAAAPSLFYADWVHPIDPRWANLKAYRARLLARPTIARVVDEARPYRHYFPLGAPDRD